MVALNEPLAKIKKQKILALGDFVLDAYTIGKVKRISPEAPVPVLHVHHEENRPGMTGNVALNLISMGMDVIVLGRIGDDPFGQILSKILSDEGIDTRGLLRQSGYPTPVKNRMIADNQQILRVDHEEICSVSSCLEEQILELLPNLINEVQLIAVSDYGKGFLTPALMGTVIELAKAKGIPVIVDPKGIDFTKYRGVDLLKPNLMELYAAANFGLEIPIEKAAEKILDQCQIPVLMTTRSEAGISVFYNRGDHEHFPVRVREIKDVTGAGDTVLAMLAVSMASGLSVAEAAQLSNVAAGIAIEKFGCSRVTLSEVAERLTVFS